MNVENIQNAVGMVLSIASLVTILLSILFFYFRHKLPFVNKIEFDEIVIKVVALEEVQKLADQQSIVRHQEIKDLIRDNSAKVQNYSDNINNYIEVLRSVKDALSEVCDKYNAADKEITRIETIVNERTNRRKED